MVRLLVDESLLGTKLAEPIMEEVELLRTEFLDCRYLTRLPRIDFLRSSKRDLDGEESIPELPESRNAIRLLTHCVWFRHLMALNERLGN